MKIEAMPTAGCAYATTASALLMKIEAMPTAGCAYATTASALVVYKL